MLEEETDSCIDEEFTRCVRRKMNLRDKIGFSPEDNTQLLYERERMKALSKKQRVIVNYPDALSPQEKLDEPLVEPKFKH